MSHKSLAPSPYVIDVHTHLYFERYIQLLRDRKVVPRVSKTGDVENLIILEDDEAMGGRPIADNYWSVSKKLEWMAENEIDHAVLSLANPWLEFMESASESSSWSNLLNGDLEQICVQNEGKFSGFGVLPMHSASMCVNEMENLSRMPHMKGIILGTAGFGKGLDDPALDPIWEKAQEKSLVVFIHPHYGVGGKQFDGYGHALHLALGFPFETTTSICRLVISGVLERFPRLKLLLAHSGGTLPFLAGRLDSCVMHDKFVADKLPHAPSFYLKKIFYDALSYHEPAVACTTNFVGPTSMMFGTDNPFSISDPPQNYRALGSLDQAAKDLICHKTASDVLSILTPLKL